MNFSNQDTFKIKSMLDTLIKKSKNWPPEYEFEALLKSKSASYYKPIDRKGFENVIKRLNTLGYEKIINDPVLDISFLDDERQSKIRVSIFGKKSIIRYCSENKIETLGNNVNFTLKQFLGKDNYIKLNDYELRFNLKKEQEFSLSSFRDTRNIIRRWTGVKKAFRYKQRYSFLSKDKLFRIDLTIVKSSNLEFVDNKRRMKYETTLLESGVFKNKPKYEIEVEFVGHKYFSRDNIIQMGNDIIISNCIKNIGLLFQALGNCYFITSKPMKQKILDAYKSLTNKDYFYAPLPITLELQNIIKYSSYSETHNINKNYSVTEKADGERNILLIIDNGNNKCSLFTYNRQKDIKFMGTTTDIKFNNTIIDGELITKDIKGRTIQLFMAFDIYYKSGVDIKSKDLKDRLDILNDIISNLNITKIENSPFRIKAKKFIIGDGQKIFDGSKNILSKENQEGYEYHIDGLVFTPIGPVWDGKEPQGVRWDSAFKWKPPEENTIDFFVRIDKDETGTDIIHSFVSSDNDVKRYKKLILFVGYKPDLHNIYNACRIVNENAIYKNEYTPTRFLPTYPYVNEAYITYVPLNDNNVIVCENGSQIPDESVVEFKYNGDEKKDKWHPLRLRDSKFPNAFNTAINVWKSIHRPITTKMITTGKYIPNEQDGYYATLKRNRKELLTYRMQEFHSKYVKGKLIEKYTKEKDSLLDLSVGKGGDLNKWIHNKLSFVLGQDISNHGINNPKNGACSRVMKKLQNNINIPTIFFIYGDSSKRIRDGSSALDELNKFYLDVLYGNIDRDKVFNKYLNKHYGIAKKKFNIISSQFSIHYFFENKEKLDSFINNVSENLKPGGYFIGTCLDGEKVYNALKDIRKNKSIQEKEGKNTIWQITKKYDSKKKFKPNDSSLGLQIDVFIDSIGQRMSEYLVNFEYLEERLTKEKFKLVNNDFFSDIFKEMEKDTNEIYNDAKSITKKEKNLSFLFRQFVFQKKKKKFNLKK